MHFLPSFRFIFVLNIAQDIAPIVSIVILVLALLFCPARQRHKIRFYSKVSSAPTQSDAWPSESRYPHHRNHFIYLPVSQPYGILKGSLTLSWSRTSFSTKDFSASSLWGLPNQNNDPNASFVIRQNPRDPTTTSSVCPTYSLWRLWIQSRYHLISDRGLEEELIQDQLQEDEIFFPIQLTQLEEDEIFFHRCDSITGSEKCDHS